MGEKSKLDVEKVLKLSLGEPERISERHSLASLANRNVAVSYKTVHRHCNVPTRQGKLIGQRMELTKNKLSEERKKMLEALDPGSVAASG